MSERDSAARERDTTRLADELERGAGDMQRRSEQLADEVAGVRHDWERKRRDDKVPGAPAPEDDTGGAPGESAEEAASHERSPAPQAPQPEQAPASAEMAPEGRTGYPADAGDDENRGD